MNKKLSSMLLALLAYTFFWPVNVDPVSWQAPDNQGYVGEFKQNNLLKRIETVEMKGTHGPEDLVMHNGLIYGSTREGWIFRHNPASGEMTNWVHTGGSPLGLAFDKENNLLVADAYLGLLKILPDGTVSLLTNQVDGTETDRPSIDYADDLAIAADNRIYFTDASTKFGAKAYGGPNEASILDIIEHGGHGRLLVYNPADQSTAVVMDGLNFANGVAIAEDSSYLLVVETGSYRIHKYWLLGERAGQSEILIDNLPGFPDNVVRGRQGRFWVGLVAPRKALLDSVSSSGFLRKVIHRLPPAMRPKPDQYGHVFAMDAEGQVLLSLQDPEANYHTNTGVLETDNWLYISSLHADDLGRISRANAGLK